MNSALEPLSRLLCFAAILCGSPEAFAGQIKLCFTASALYDDCGRSLRDGTTEDYTTSCPAQVKAYGTYAIVRYGSNSNGPVMWQGYLGDGLGSGDPGAGCTPVVTVPNISPATFYLRLNSSGRVQDNDIRTSEQDGDNIVYMWGTRSLATNVEPPASTTVAFTSTESPKKQMWTAHLATSFALYRHAGGMTGKTYNLRVGSEGNYVDPYGSGILLDLDGSVRKFTTVHEVGHQLARHGGILSGDCSVVNLPAGNVCAAHQQEQNQSTFPARHSMGSKEDIACAFSEGFAHFYAADVWNLHSEEDCAFGYYKRDVPVAASCGAGCPAGSVCYDDGRCYQRPTVDCGPLAGSYLERTSPTRYSDPLNGGYYHEHLEDECASPLTDRGTEVDWMRVFWMMHAQGSSPTDFTSIRQWLSGASTHWFGNIYDKADAEAQTIGGSLETNWNAAAATFGVDQ